jgi:hypothetical protein
MFHDRAAAGGRVGRRRELPRAEREADSPNMSQNYTTTEATRQRQTKRNNYSRQRDMFANSCSFIATISRNVSFVNSYALRLVCRWRVAEREAVLSLTFKPPTALVEDSLVFEDFNDFVIFIIKITVHAVDQSGDNICLRCVMSF